MHSVTIPWPNQGASLNSRKNWREKSKIAKSIKSAASALSCSLPKCHKEQVHVYITFFPPDKRRRDADNLLGSIKPALDAISDKIGLDDSNFWPITLQKGWKDKENPRVQINLYY